MPLNTLIGEIKNGIDERGVHLLYGDRLSVLCDDRDELSLAQRAELIAVLAAENGWQVEVREDAGVALFSRA